MKFMLSCLVAISIIAAGALAGAETTVTQVTSNSIEDTFPQVCGDFVVWQGYAHGDWEVFLYSIPEKTTTQITDNVIDDILPETDGHYVVWQGFNNGQWDVFLWNGSEIQVISDASAEDIRPQIANGVVVWTSQPLEDGFLGLGDIMLYRVGTGTRSVLSAEVDPTNVLDDTAPRIDDKVVVWIQTDDEENTVVYTYNLSTGVIEQGTGSTGNPQDSSNLIALTRYDGTDREILLYNSATHTCSQITNNDVEDRCHSVCGHYIVWVSGEGTSSEIWLAVCEEEAVGGGGGTCFIESAAHGWFIPCHPD